MSKYDPYFRVTDDGYLWWPLKDAIRLAAGYQPQGADNQALEPEWRAAQFNIIESNGSRHHGQTCYVTTC